MSLTQATRAAWWIQLSIGVLAVVAWLSRVAVLSIARNKGDLFCLGN